MTSIISTAMSFFIAKQSKTPTILKKKSIKKVNSTGGLSSHAMDAPEHSSKLVIPHHSVHPTVTHKIALASNELSEKNEEINSNSNDQEMQSLPEINPAIPIGLYSVFGFLRVFSDALTLKHYFKYKQQNTLSQNFETIDNFIKQKSQKNLIKKEFSKEKIGGKGLESVGFSYPISSLGIAGNTLNLIGKNGAPLLEISSHFFLGSAIWTIINGQIEFLKTLKASSQINLLKNPENPENLSNQKYIQKGVSSFKKQNTIKKTISLLLCGPVIFNYLFYKFIKREKENTQINNPFEANKKWNKRLDASLKITGGICIVLGLSIPFAQPLIIVGIGLLCLKPLHHFAKSLFKKISKKPINQEKEDIKSLFLHLKTAKKELENLEKENSQSTLTSRSSARQSKSKPNKDNLKTYIENLEKLILEKITLRGMKIEIINQDQESQSLQESIIRKIELLENQIKTIKLQKQDKRNEEKPDEINQKKSVVIRSRIQSLTFNSSKAFSLSKSPEKDSLYPNHSSGKNNLRSINTQAYRFLFRPDKGIEPPVSLVSNSSN